MDGGAYTYENTEPENNIDNQIVIAESSIYTYR